MCRLYALQATHPTRMSCELLDAQNALIEQSRDDTRGLSNPHGWGLASLNDGRARCFRQVQPASRSKGYRRASMRLTGTTLLAHVRRATVGTPRAENTHPFRHEDAFLIHNGHVPAFDEVRPRILNCLSAERRQTIDGSTDSEHVFALLLQLREEMPNASLHEVTREAIHRLQSWCDDASGEVYTGVSDVPFDDLDTVDDEIIHRTLALNLIWTDGTWIGGARLNRSLWTLRRTEFYECPICENDHTEAPESEHYRATALASEPVTDENWAEVPNGSVFHVADDGLLSPFSLTV